MNGNEIKEFLNQLYSGEELVFEYKGTKYFLQGWCDKDKKCATMVLDKVEQNPFSGYVWQFESPSMKQCADAFINSQIFDSKTFSNILKDVIWSDW